MRTRAFLAAALLLAGCSMDPKLDRPDLPVPASWPVGDAYLRQSEAALPAVTYPQVFRDPRLQRLIALSLANNRDLAVSVANIRAARALYVVQRAQRFPQLDGTARYQYQEGGRGASNVTGGGTTPGGTGPGAGTNPGGANPGTGGGGTVITQQGGGSSYSLGVAVTAFELDVFGRVASLTRAARDRYFAQEAAARSVRLTLVGDVAQAWLTYAADRSLLRVAENARRIALDSVRLTKLRLDGGVAPRSDLSQAQTILATADATLADQRALLAQDENAIRLLAGTDVPRDLLPDDMDQALNTLAVLPAGLSSEVLLRRPDVVQAEYTLRAFNAEVGAARAALFPRISLTGIVGFASNALSSLFSGDAFNFSAAPTAAYPIFRAGAGRANVRFSQAQRDAAIASYERAIQSAFRETADALARQGTVGEQLRAARAQFSATDETLRLNDLRYRGGIDTFLSNLDAQRSLLSAQQQLVNTQLLAATNRVNLYRALGGDSTLETRDDGPAPVTPSGAPRADDPLPDRTRDQATETDR